MFGNSISKFLKLDHVIENLTGYVETKVALIKIELKEDLAEGLGKAITYILIAFVFAMVLMFISIGIALILAARLGNFTGFGIVAAVYLVVGMVLLANRDTLSREISKQASKAIKKK
jgi:hypothetical protein